MSEFTNYFDIKTHYKKTVLKLFGFLIMCAGFLMMFYVFFPLISWQIYFAPSFSEQDIAIPIPKTELITEGSVKNLLENASVNLTTDYNNARNWFPDYKKVTNNTLSSLYYKISIPKIDINNAIVSTNDTDLSKHLINYPGSSLPPERGNAVIFGHSTLPQLYDKNNYKTIFANLYKLETGDEITVDVSDKKYKYRITSVIVVDPQNTSVLEQNYDSSFLTIVTCTPPGTVWKRLVVRATIVSSI